MKSLGTIATALGAERARNELLPYILGNSNPAHPSDLLDDDEEILVQLGETLKGFVPLIGGPAHAVAVLKILENLACFEEQPIRSKAVDSMKTILSTLKMRDFEGELVQIIKRLVAAEGYASKFSAIQLIPHIHSSLSSNAGSELLQVFSKLSQDQVPQVRKTVAVNLQEMIKLIPKVSEQEVVAIFNKLLQDDQDSVRMQGIDNAVQLAKVLPVA